MEAVAKSSAVVAMAEINYKSETLLRPTTMKVCNDYSDVIE